MQPACRFLALHRQCQLLITGFKSLPEFGDEFEVVANEHLAKSHANTEKIKKNTINGRLTLIALT